MIADPLHDIFASVRARLQEELEAQLRAVAERHEQALAEARRSAEAEAEERWSERLESVRTDAGVQTETAVAAARAEAERTTRDEIGRVTADAQARTAEEVSRTREQMEQALADERQRADARVEDERRKAGEQLELARRRYEAERDLATQAATAVVSGAGLLDALKQLDRADSISATLSSIVRAAGRSGGRASLFVLNGRHLTEWTGAGLVPRTLSPAAADGGGDILLEALTTHKSVRRGRSAVAAPLLLEGVTVAVLYVDVSERDADDGSALDIVEAVALQGAAHLGRVTAVKTAQARQWLDTRSAGDGGRPLTSQMPVGAADDEEAAARRFARLLVSEIKMYNEGAVRAGRDHHDLLVRLGAEIERARRVYEERVPVTVAGRAQHFHDELVQTLAGGDPSLLG